MEKRLDRLRSNCTKAQQGKTAARPLPVAGLRRTVWVVAVLTGLAVAGCASLNADSAPEAKQKVVAERAEARWQALMKGDLDAAYAFLSPASKKATPLMEYARTIKPGMWRKVKVDKVDCEAEICKAQLSVTYDNRMMKGITTPVWETWIIEQGSAWYVYR
jgi:hypothetical protein